MPEVEGHDRPLPAVRLEDLAVHEVVAVDPAEAVPVEVLQAVHLVAGVAGEVLAVPENGPEGEPLDEPEPQRQRLNLEERQRPVLEPLRRVPPPVEARVGEGDVHRPAAEVRLVQQVEGPPVHHQGAQAARVPEDLVVGEHREVGGVGA